MARVLSVVGGNEFGTSRVLPPLLAAAIRTVARGPVPWVIPVGPILGVPPAGMRPLPDVRAPPRAATLGGRRLGGEAKRARLMSLLARDQHPLSEHALPSLEELRQNLKSSIHYRKPVAVSHGSTKSPKGINAYTYPLFANMRCSRGDAKHDAYASEAGYRDDKPRLGMGFKYDAPASLRLA